MAKNIEMNIKTESGYEILYPQNITNNTLVSLEIANLYEITQSSNSDQLFTNIKERIDNINNTIENVIGLETGNYVGTGVNQATIQLQHVCQLLFIQGCDNSGGTHDTFSFGTVINPGRYFICMDNLGSNTNRRMQITTWDTYRMILIDSSNLKTPYINEKGVTYYYASIFYK